MLTQEWSKCQNMLNSNNWVFLNIGLHPKILNITHHMLLHKVCFVNSKAKRKGYRRHVNKSIKVHDFLI